MQERFQDPGDDDLYPDGSEPEAEPEEGFEPEPELEPEAEEAPVTDDELMGDDLG